MNNNNIEDHLGTLDFNPQQLKKNILRSAIGVSAAMAMNNTSRLMLSFLIMSTIPMSPRVLSANRCLTK
ncbi:MAG: hypothetical protein ACI9WS_002619 [Paraglaciecola psychrophila]|jgi:hypothetical protein